MAKKKGYGGIFDPVINCVLNAISRNLLVATGRKKPYRGGARIRKWRDTVEGKDKKRGL